MSSKTTASTKKNATYVAWSARALAEKVGSNVLDKLKPLLEEGEQLPDILFFQELLGRFLDRRSRQLVEVDSRYTEDQRVGRSLRLERQRQLQVLRQTLGDARFLLDRQLGREESAVHLTVRSYWRLDAGRLIQLARETAVALRAPGVAWERSVARGIATSSATMAEALEAEAGKLDELVQNREGLQARMQQVGLEEKQAEQGTVKLAIRSGASLLAGLYTFADLPFHAQRVRRRARKGGAAEEEMGEAMDHAKPGGVPPLPAAMPQEVSLPIA